MNFITLKELKKMVPVASEFKRVPGLKKILEDGIEVMKASKSIRLTRGIDASLEKPLSSKARKSSERFFQLWKKKKCKLRILIGCWT